MDEKTARRSTGTIAIIKLSTSGWASYHCHNESKEFGHHSRAIRKSEHKSISPLICRLIWTWFALFFQLYLIINGKRVKKKKSSTGKSGDPRNPVWNEVFTFNFSQSNLQNAAIEVSLDCWVSTKNIHINKCVKYFQIYVVSSGGEANAIGCGIGPQEHGQGRHHWQDMIHARQPTALWHYLR